MFTNKQHLMEIHFSWVILIDVFIHITEIFVNFNDFNETSRIGEHLQISKETLYKNHGIFENHFEPIYVLFCVQKIQF